MEISHYSAVQICKIVLFFSSLETDCSGFRVSECESEVERRDGKRWEAAGTTVTVPVRCVAWRSIRPLGFPATSFPLRFHSQRGGEGKVPGKSHNPWPTKSSPKTTNFTERLCVGFEYCFFFKRGFPSGVTYVLNYRLFRLSGDVFGCDRDFSGDLAKVRARH